MPPAGVITSAGILLAAVFTVLGVLPVIALTQIGTIVGIGILLVRTLVVTAIALIRRSGLLGGLQGAQAGQVAEFEGWRRGSADGSCAA